jgi:hypothetical protein
MSELLGHHIKTNESTHNDKYFMILLSGVVRMIRLMETESRMVVSRSWEKEHWKSFNGCGVLVT